jgi:hypothetical protein
MVKYISVLSILLYAAVMPYGSTGGPLPDHSLQSLPVGDTESADTPVHITASPNTRTVISSIYGHIPLLADISRNQSVSVAGYNTKDIRIPVVPDETPLLKAASIYLLYSDCIVPNLTVRELLFPFHHFL